MTAAVALACLVAVAPAHGARPTGRHLVTFERAADVRSAAVLSAVLGRAGAARAGHGVPRLGIATVRGSAAGLARLRRDPAVESVSREWQRDFRAQPNDPALSTPETEFGGLPGNAPLQWALARERFPAAWDIARGDGAIVAVLDSGIDGGHPELAGKLHSFDEIGSGSGIRDADGHGTHTAGLACAATNNGLGIAGAGWNCRIAVVKVPRLFDEDIIRGIDAAVSRGVHAINMSFGGGGSSPALDDAIDRAVAHGIVLVSSASNEPVADQGAPASQLQPGDAANITAGRGLVVTGADFADTRASTGFGTQISLAAYGFYDELLGPPGLISTYPSNYTERDAPLLGCGCRRTFIGDNRYAYLQGTSMAAPQVAALAAMVGALNPFLSVREKLRLLKETARRQGGWNPELGWGIIDAGRAVDAARRIDHVQPSSQARSRRRVRPRRGARRVRLRVRWSGADPGGRPGLIASGVASYDLYLRRGRGGYRRVRRATTRRTTVLRLRPGIYRLHTQASDRSGNRESAPARADVRVVVVARR